MKRHLAKEALTPEATSLGPGQTLLVSCHMELIRVISNESSFKGVWWGWKIAGNCV
jgi:hypothetical protein